MERTKEEMILERLHRLHRKTRAGGPEHRAPRRGHGPFPRERVLAVLASGDEGGMRQKDLAEVMGIQAPALTEQIAHLASAGYVERRVNPKDKRSTLVVLTDLGRARSLEVRDDRRERAASFCSSLTEKEKDALLSLLDKLLEA